MKALNEPLGVPSHQPLTAKMRVDRVDFLMPQDRTTSMYVPGTVLIQDCSTKKRGRDSMLELVLKGIKSNEPVQFLYAGPQTAYGQDVQGRPWAD